jgi:hypothetical protein
MTLDALRRIHADRQEAAVGYGNRYRSKWQLCVAIIGLLLSSWRCATNRCLITWAEGVNPLQPLSMQKLKTV